MDFKDYYASLEIAKTAADKDIKQAFRKLARKYHPDLNPGDKKAEARFKEINEANEVLSDPAKRKKYDELGANWRMYEQAQQQRGGAGSPFGQYGFPGGGGGATYRQVSQEDLANMLGGEDSPFSDFFRTFFGGVDPAAGSSAGAGGARRARSRSTRPSRGHDVEHEIELDLEDALRGTVQRLGINDGGEVRNVEVRIPAGVVDGSRVRVAGAGGRGASTDSSGDLFLRVALRPHSRFERKGRDLYARVPVPVTTAVLGGEVEVTTPLGKSLRLRVPEGTQNGRVFRLRGHGLPNTAKDSAAGDIYATVDLTVPQPLSPEQRKHYEALAALESQP